ncbi:HNH endonuclease [Gracilibacillus salitolerans]|uniref:HNH endonuclease n=1 Tax=Gracilibacillus salitolerans TaxID=2663022 RepID=A0A5Q2TK58_9BACI|nr:HNH endonuclease [Gracilibacillus salitolerans]QGH35116.1 HNH endonuclease [Gracilibacillus salitolerans]
MGFDPGLNIGQVITNDQIRDIFKCGNMGGMRKSNTTNTLVIVTDHTKGLYEDRWEGDVLHYTGMGKNGDQDINFSQNRTLNESNSNEVEVFLFEVIKEREYTYLGPVILYGTPYQDEQPGEDEQKRKVWVFPIKLKYSEKAHLIAKELMDKDFFRKQKKVVRLTTLELRKRAEQTRSTVVGSRNTLVNTYERNLYVTEYAKRRANGICELCEQPAPFLNKKGEPYLETHHIDWLSNGGKDTIKNTVALCPNCHRKMHAVDSKEDIIKLKEIRKF